MNSPEQIPPKQSVEQSVDQVEYAGDSLSYKELASMLAEIRADEEAVVRIIDDFLLEPIPDLTDQAAVEEFNAKMAAVRDIAQSQLGRSDLLKEIWGRIESRIGPVVAVEGN